MGSYYTILFSAITMFIFLSFPLSAQEGAYVNKISITQGDTLKFYVSTSSNPFTLRITRFLSTNVTVRMGDFTSIPGGVRTVPTDAYMNGCNWPETYRMVIPDTWEPGMYRATFPTTSGGGGVLFFVKAKTQGSFANTLILLNTNTWQAYNTYGGKNLYPSSSSSRSYKVSFERPSDHGYGAYTFFRQELKYADWMYLNNYKFEYATDYDVHSDPTLLSKYKVVVIAGHSEYWSYEQRRNIDKYVNNGGKLMILGGNTCWWQVRFENNGKTLVCYKSSSADPLTGVADSLVTVNWYASPVNNPENSTIGVSFRNGGYVNSHGVLPASEGYGDYAALNTHHWVYKGTNLKDGDEYGYENLIVGNEVDGALYRWANALPEVTGADKTPLNYRILGISPAQSISSNFNGLPGIYHTPSGGALFNAATLKWNDGLASGNNIVFKITHNVYNRFLKNAFPPDILRWTPYVEQNATVNNMSIKLNKREVTANSGDNIRFSVKAMDPQNKSMSFRWLVGNSSAGSDSVLNFAVGNEASYNVTALVYNSTDTSRISWNVTVEGNSQVIPDVPVLASPSNGSTDVASTLLLRWNSVSSAEFYDLQVSQSSSFSSLTLEKRVTSTSEEVTLETGKTYYWRVRAGNQAGTSNYSSYWSFTTAAVQLLPGEVVLVYPERNQKNLPRNITFVWRSAERSDSYRLIISTDKQFRTIVYDESTNSDTSRTVNALQIKKNHWWKVIAVNNNGETSSEVRQFATGSGQFSKESIVRIKAEQINFGERVLVKISWDSPEDAPSEYYHLDRSVSPGLWETITTIEAQQSINKQAKVELAGSSQDNIYRLLKYFEDGSVLVSEDFTVDVIPAEFSISQNYPNPFNPETQVDFIVPYSSRVQILLFDIKGELVRTILDETREPGFYTTRINASSLSSGVYFYQYIAVSSDGNESYNAVKKLVLLK
jgi:hypothetical protein